MKDKISTEDNKRISNWHQELKNIDEGYIGKMKWNELELNTEDWSTMKVPGYWAYSELGPMNGVVWFRKKIKLPLNLAYKDAKLYLGRIIDADSIPQI